MLHLYEHPLSPYAQKCKLALLEKGIAFEASIPSEMGTGRAAGAFVEANPRAEVPALIDGDVKVFDSTVILEYIEDKWPTPPMLPSHPAERARVRMIEDVMDTQYEAINWGLLEIHAFKRAGGDLAASLQARAKQQSAGFQAWLERELGDRPWFNGASFGWGDFSVLPHLNTSALYGNGPRPGSKLAAWLTRANERDSVKQVVAAARQAAGNLANVASLVERGLFKREYRDHRLEWMLRSGGLPIVLKGLDAGNIRFSRELS
ncbi:MAG TPA: glutathione S-transferase family protein [Candidatus Cybelea sp.]|nr:glutathione S-transferase family protein [Candidatus Cybelea sp.]